MRADVCLWGFCVPSTHLPVQKHNSVLEYVWGNSRGTKSTPPTPDLCSFSPSLRKRSHSKADRQQVREVPGACESQMSRAGRDPPGI